MGAWENYQVAAQRLDAVRREAATLVAERTAVAKGARKEIAAARQRLAAQRGRLLGVANRAGVPAPSVTPDATEKQAALAALGTIVATQGTNPAAAATMVVRGARTSFDQVDTALSTLDDPNVRTSTGLGRNSLVYAIVALITCLIPVLLVLFGPTDPGLGATAVNLGSYCSAAILPLMGYGLAWLIVGQLGRSPNERRPNRSAAVGALITVGCVVLVYGSAIALA